MSKTTPQAAATLLTALAAEIAKLPNNLESLTKISIQTGHLSPDSLHRVIEACKAAGWDTVEVSSSTSFHGFERTQLVIENYCY